MRLADASPLAAALGPNYVQLAPALRDYFNGGASRTYSGRMTRVWRRGGGLARLAAPALWLAARTGTMTNRAGDDVPFDLDVTFGRDEGGRPTMRLVRTFHFADGASQPFAALVTYDVGRNLLTDRLGRRGGLAVELIPSVEGRELTLTSARQWLRLCGVRLRIPRLLAGHAVVREWEELDGSIGIHVRVASPLPGELLGYEGAFRPAAAPAAQEEVRP